MRSGQTPDAGADEIRAGAWCGAGHLSSRQSRARAAAPQHEGDEMATIRVLLVDDHAVMRAGLRALLASEPDMEVVGEASTGEEAVELAERLRPEVAVMDLSMPGMGGLAAT